VPWAEPLQITRLRLAGFKSFVHPTEFAIEPGLTGIVGPNGCGKSNLIDALRWVMGETSARGLRGGEMDDVIFAGTGARPAFDLAEVALRIQAPEVALPGLGEEEELDLSRRIGRGVGSVFRVNGKELRARDIQLLFADAASGARSAAIVTQGQIGALIEAKPADRRRLLEEAAGIGGLQARRHEAELKLQAAEANLVRVEDLLLSLEEQERGLVKQARQAERYRKLSAAWREVEAALLVGRWRLAAADLATAEAALRDGRDSASSEAGRLGAARRQYEQAGQALSTLRAREAELRTEQVRLRERLGAVDDQAARLDATRARLAERDRQIIQDLTHGQAALEDARTTGERLAAERRSLAAAVAQHGRDLERAEAAAAEAAEAARAADSGLRQALGEVAEADARRQQLVDRRAAAVREQESASEAGQEVRTRLATLAGPAPASGGPDGLDALELEVEQAAGAEAAALAALAAADLRQQATRMGLQAASERLRELRERRRSEEARAQRLEDQRARLAELDQRRERLALRLEETGARAEAGAMRQQELDLPALEQLAAAAEQALQTAGIELDAANAWLAAANAARDEGEAGVQSRRTTLDRLQAEASALAELAGPGRDQGGVIEAIRVADGYAQALAAALGDDLTASLDPAAASHWRAGLDEAGDRPALPAGCRSLAEVVEAPPALARRLAQIGIVDVGAGDGLQPALAQGQRLVSVEGGLWRWDGLVRRPDAEDSAAARLRQAARRHQLAALLADQQSLLEAAEEAARAAAIEAAAAAERARAGAAAASEARAQDQRQREAVLQRRADAAALAAELQALTQERSALQVELAELDAMRQAVLGQLQQLSLAGAPPAGSAGDELEAAAAAEAEIAEQDLQAQAAQAGARSALAEARAGLAAAREGLERQRAADQSRAAAERERELERVRLEAELVRLEQERDRRVAALGALAAALEDAEVGLGSARARLAEAEQADVAARQAEAEARMQQGRLRDRLAAAEGRSATVEQELALWSERARAAAARLEELGRRRRELAEELAGLDEQPAALARQRAEIAARLVETESQTAARAVEIGAAEAALNDTQAALERAEGARVEAREVAARLEARLERAAAETAVAEAALRARLGDPPGAGPEPPPDAAELTELESELARLGALRERLGPVNLRAIDEARELALRIETLRAEQAELTGAIERLRRAISTLNREGRERLRAAFAKVERHFEALFARLFGGGRARLELTDLEDPLAAGLELSASPPGKKLQSITLLSGGEKALTALALIFAVFLTKPAPLCVLDEVDAPLDDANVDRLMALLEELAEGTRTRFLVITHHPLTMARMHRLYGVTMVERGISQLVSVDLTGAIELRATA
jgi:chromosome segregation protein